MMRVSTSGMHACMPIIKYANLISGGEHCRVRSMANLHPRHVDTRVNRAGSHTHLFADIILVVEGKILLGASTFHNADLLDLGHEALVAATRHSAAYLM
jgi:hypothetical protein